MIKMKQMLITCFIGAGTGSMPTKYQSNPPTIHKTIKEMRASIIFGYLLF